MTKTIEWAEGYRLYYFLAVLMLCYIFSFLDRGILSIIVDPIRNDLRLTEVEMGFIMGPAFGVLYILFAPVMGHIADVGSRQLLIVCGVAIWSAATVACGLAVGFWTLCIARMLVGAGEAALAPAGYSIMPDTVRPERLGLALSVFSSGVTIGAGLALVGGGFVVEFTSQTEIADAAFGGVDSWRIALFAVGLPGFLVALLVFFTIREPARRTQSKDGRSLADLFGHFRRHYKTLSCASLALACLSMVNYAGMLWAPTFLMRVHGFSAGEVGLFFGLVTSIGGTSGAICGGYICDRFISKGRVTAPLLVTLGTAAISTPLLTFAFGFEDNRFSLILLSVGTAISCGAAGMHGVSVASLVPANLRGRATAVHLMIVSFAGTAVAPMLTAFLTQNIFKGDQHIGSSLATTTALAGMASIALVAIALPSARKLIAELRRT